MSWLLLLVAIVLGGRPAAPQETTSVAARNPFDTPGLLQAHALRGLRTSVIGDILSAPDGGDLAFAALAVPLPTGGERVKVPFFVEIDGASFLQFNQSETTRVEVYVYALGPERQIVDFVAEVFGVAVGADGERIWQSGLEYFGLLELPPGEYSLRVLIRNFQSRAHGLRTLALEVPGPPADGPIFSRPLVGDPEGRDVWLPVRAARPLESEQALGYPLAEIGLDLNPAARPVLISGRTTEVLIPVAGLGAGEVTGRLELLPQDGSVLAPVAETGKGPAIRAPGGGVGAEILRLEVEVPEVAPGPYRARIRFSRDGVGDLTTSELEVLVASAETRDRDLLWSDMRWLLGRSQQVAKAPEAVEKKRRRRAAAEARRARGELAGRYRQIVESFGQESDEMARGALFEFESRPLSGAVGQKIENLHQAELSVASELGRRDPGRLVSLALLHGEMYGRYRGRRLYALLHHTRTLLEELADLHVEVGGSPETAAEILVSLAGHMQDANLAGGSRRLFSRALEYHPENSAAMLGLAAGLEKYGEYSAAISYLELLVAGEPEFRQGLLRLAINLERVGLRRRALELLERASEGDDRDWVTSVACEELGRLYVQMGELTRAAELLERATEQSANRQGASLLLAHVYDRLGRSREAIETLREVRAGSGLGPSARWLYDRWPRELLERTRSRLLERASAVRPSDTSDRTIEGKEAGVEGGGR